MTAISATSNNMAESIARANDPGRLVVRIGSKLPVGATGTIAQVMGASGRCLDEDTHEFPDGTELLPGALLFGSKNDEHDRLGRDQHEGEWMRLRDRRTLLWMKLLTLQSVLALGGVIAVSAQTAAASDASAPTPHYRARPRRNGCRAGGDRDAPEG